MATIARMLVLGLVTVSALTVWAIASPQSGPQANLKPGLPSRTVYLAGKLSEEGLISLGCTVASQPGALLLLDSQPLTTYLRHFLAAYRPERVVPVGEFADDAEAIGCRLGVDVEPVLTWPEQTRGPCPAWKLGASKVESVVVCAPRPGLDGRRFLLSAAALASSRGIPLWLGDSEPRKFRTWLREVGATTVLVAGEAPGLKLRKASTPSGVRVTWLRTPAEVDLASQRHLAALGPIRTAVLCNPADTTTGKMSLLAPWLVGMRQAALLTTAEDGKDAQQVVMRQTRLGSRGLKHLDAVILLASLQAIPVQQRPNPIPGDKDKFIDMEPLTPEGREPFSYAIGRLFDEDLAVVPLMLARQRLLREQTGSRKVLVASNPGGGLPLLETFSRNTVQEMENVGYEVEALYGKDLTARVLRERMPGKDIFLWEGHHNTLVKEWGFTTWDEPMPPMFVCLQSCLALEPHKVHGLLARGAYAVVGTSTRTYSGSGGAFSLSFFNGLLYEGQSLGGSLRQSKNFLLAYAQLKEKRLQGQAKRTGANQRAAWAFTLWGDPTFELPRPEVPAGARPGVRQVTAADTIRVLVPEERHATVVNDRFVVRMPPNARLAGLIRKERDAEGQPLVPFVFAEIQLPGRGAQVPRLRSRLPASQWVFLWDRRRQVGYLLVVAAQRNEAELRFRVEWPGTTALAIP